MRLLSLLVLGLAGQWTAQAGNLIKVWDLDLRTVLEAKGFRPTRDLPVLALRFSPDGARFAAVVDLYGLIGAQEHKGSFLLVTTTEQAALHSRVFEVTGGIGLVDEYGPGPHAVSWLPSGLAVDAGGSVFDVKGKKCEVPWRGFFTTDSLFIALDSRGTVSAGDSGAPISNLTFFGSDCQRQGSWGVPESWDLKDVSPERGLLSVSRLVVWPDRYENLIVDPIARNVLHRWPETQVPIGTFADRGKAICSGSDVEDSDEAPVACWEVDTGKKIAQAPTLNGGDPMETATRTTRIAASDVYRRRIPFSNEYTRVLKRRVIWDFGSGKELVSWWPQYQSYDLQIGRDSTKRLKHVHEPFRFAISPDGQYILEGGSGALHLYKVEP